jgi:predicted dehydrogenase
MDRARLAVIGVGHLGKEHARILAAHPEVELVAVVDARSEQAEAIGLRCRCQSLTDHTPLLKTIDAAVIAVPTTQHHAVACDFLACGVHLLIEKPITGTLAEADELLHLARRHGAIVQVGHVERFNPAFEELTRRPMRPKMVNAMRLAPFSGRSLDIGVVLDLMIHDIDMLLSLVPAPVRHAEAMGVCLLGGNEDLAHAQLTFATGCVAHLSASRVHSSAVRHMDVWSAEGYAAADFHKRQLTLVQPGEQLRALRTGRHAPILRPDLGPLLFERREYDCNCEGPDQLTRELNEFVAAVRTGSKVRVTGEDGREALAVASMILDSIRRHAWEGEVMGPVGPTDLPVPAGTLFTPQSDRAAA